MHVLWAIGIFIFSSGALASPKICKSFSTDSTSAQVNWNELASAPEMPLSPDFVNALQMRQYFKRLWERFGSGDRLLFAINVGYSAVSGKPLNDGEWVQSVFLRQL